MVARALQKLTSQTVYVAGELKGYVQWGAPGAVLVGWLAWPALTPAFKAETLGLKPAVVPGAAPAAAAPKDDIFRSGGKYKFVRNEIGERPTLEEDDE